MNRVRLVLLGGILGAALCYGALSLSRKHAPAPKIYVATLLIDDRSQMRLASFIDLETSEAAVRSHVGEFVQTRFPGGRLVSIEIGSVAEEMIAAACATRRAAK